MGGYHKPWVTRTDTGSFPASSGAGAGGGPGGPGAYGPRPGSVMPGIPRKPGPVGAGYVCHRCGQPGHFANKCPMVQNDDGTFEQRALPQRLMNVSNPSRKRVASLAGIDIKNKTVIPSYILHFNL
jgi:hypothetical protein